jgi:hypothetical protein
MKIAELVDDECSKVARSNSTAAHLVVSYETSRTPGAALEVPYATPLRSEFRLVMEAGQMWTALPRSVAQGEPARRRFRVRLLPYRSSSGRPTAWRP